MTHEEKAAELLKRCLDAIPQTVCQGHGDYDDNSQLIHEVREWLMDRATKQSSGVGNPACIQFFPNSGRERT